MHWPQGGSWELGLAEIHAAEGSAEFSNSLTPARAVAARAALVSTELPSGMIHGMH